MSEDRDSDSNMRVDTDLIRQLADLLTQMDLTEIEVEDNDRRIVVKRKITAQGATFAVAAPSASSAPAAATIPAAPAAISSADDNGASHPGSIKSPMVGTVYLSPEPGAGPFVAPGMSVNQGDTLLIIEAMKVMNPITAPRAGTVTRVMVQDAQPVEYDQPLVIIE